MRKVAFPTLFYFLVFKIRTYAVLASFIAAAEVVLTRCPQRLKRGGLVTIYTRKEERMKERVRKGESERQRKNVKRKRQRERERERNKSGKD